MEKQMQGDMESDGGTAPGQPFKVIPQERNGVHFFRSVNHCSSSSSNLGLRLSTEKNDTGTPDLESVRCSNNQFSEHKHSCSHSTENSECDLSSDHFIKSGDLWANEFLSEEASEEDVAAGSSENSDHLPILETAECIDQELPTLVKSDYGCAKEDMGSIGDTYSEIGDHACSRGCHHFSSYQQRPLDGERNEDRDYGRQMEAEEDSFKVTGVKRASRRGKHRNTMRDEFRRNGRQPPSFSGKQKLARKKSHGEGKHHLKSMVPQPLTQLFNICLQFLINLVLLIGEYVETLGTQLYIRLWLPAHDLGNWKLQLRTFGQLIDRMAKESWILTCSCGFRVIHVLKMLYAWLFPLIILTVSCAPLCWQYMKRVVGSVGRKSNWRSWISIRLNKIWAFMSQNRTYRRLVNILKGWTSRLWPFKLRTGKETVWTSTGSPSSGRYQPMEEVERLLTMAVIPEEELNPFQVLGVEMNASDTELKKAYRQLAVLVHPDKNNHPRAEEAFKVLRAAWDTVSNPERRKEYEMKRMSETELAKSMNEFLTKLQDDLKEAMNSMMCSKCQGKHRRFEMDRDPANARYCAECGKMHPADEGDFWAESSMLGLKITYFAMMQGKVFDITGLHQKAIQLLLPICRTC
ncbi:dnaJ homolog subfamily C member 14 isoform 2-T2 [Rhinophrynus dorsalis]